jgi:NAD(P)-dependent dehydrogenase (short-subunit alcohol dehydrogenase family)
MPSVLITGADRGFGLFLCREFLARGFTVFAGKFLQDYTLLEKEREQLAISNKKKAEGELHIIPLDVGDSASIVKARDLVKESVTSIDMLISNAAIMGKVQCGIDEPPLDLGAPWNFFRVNALGPTRLVEHFLPLLDNGEMKRLCFVSSEVSCVTLMKHRAGSSYPYPMSKSSLNMSVRLMHNLLYPQGYSFRLYHPGWMKKQMPDGSLSELEAYDPSITAAHAAKYFEAPLGDEQRLVLYDYKSQEWPF